MLHLKAERAQRFERLRLSKRDLLLFDTEATRGRLGKRAAAECSYPPQCRREHHAASIAAICTFQIVGNCPLAYVRQRVTMISDMVKGRKQIQPRAGVERAFGQVIRTIRRKQLQHITG